MFLSLDKVSVGASTSKEVVVASTFQDEAVTHDIDDIGILDGRETTGDRSLSGLNERR